MLTISIPGGAALAIEHLVLDYNGTLAVGGALLPGVSHAPERAGRGGAGTRNHRRYFWHGTRAALDGVNCTLSILPPGGQDAAKLAYIQAIGAGANRGGRERAQRPADAGGRGAGHRRAGGRRRGDRDAVRGGYRRARHRVHAGSVAPSPTPHRHTAPMKNPLRSSAFIHVLSGGQSWVA